MRRVLIHTDSVPPTPAFPAFLDGFGSTALDTLHPVVGTNGPVIATGRSFPFPAHGSFLPLDAIDDDGILSLASASAEGGRLIHFSKRNAVAEPAMLAVSAATPGGLALDHRSRVGCR
jgi:hypothetical protein